MTPHHYAFTTIYDALRAGLIDWAGVQRSQEQRYPPCANGCTDALGKFRTADGRNLCETCYLPAARAEIERGLAQ